MSWPEVAIRFLNAIEGLVGWWGSWALAGVVIAWKGVERWKRAGVKYANHHLAGKQPQHVFRAEQRKRFWANMGPWE